MAPGGFPGHQDGGWGTSGSGSAPTGAAPRIAATVKTVTMLLSVFNPHMPTQSNPETARGGVNSAKSDGHWQAL
ncbi:MAG: hypothetical protein K0R68_3076 [Mycobacterium sp.]|nr:hypothetical protein [Mycobacterium sp.]